MYRLGLVLSLVVLTCTSVFAQGTSTFNGRVTDSSTAVVAGADVAVTNKATGVTRTTKTNSDGLYSFPALPAGAYDLKAQSTGFAPSTRTGVNLVTDTTLTMDFQLAVAGTAQDVQVTEEAPMVETTQSHLSSNLQHAEVQELPMLNRSVSSLIALNPGVREETTNMNVPGTSTTHTYFNVGGNGRNSMELVDGMDNHDDNDAGATMELTLEGIQEFNVMAHGAPAEYGRTGGGVASLVTKSGGNQIHGSAFAYGRSDSFTKVDYFSDPAHGGPGKPAYSREQYGGSVGGPIKKDRAWYFGALERINQNYNLPIPSNIVALEQFLVPLNLSVLPAATIPQPFHDLVGTAKFDIQLTSKQTVSFRFAGELTTLWNSTLGASNTISPLPAPPLEWSDINHFPSTNYAIKHTYLISSNTVNEFGLAYLHYKKNDYNMNCMGPTQGGQGPSLGLTVEQCLARNLTFPSIVTKNFGTGGWNDYDEEHIQFKETLSKQIGKHAFKFGGDYMWVPYANGSQSLTAGSLVFFNDPDAIVNSGNQWAATPGSCTTAFGPNNSIDSTHCGPYKTGFSTPGIVRTMNLAAQTTPNFQTLRMYYWSAFGQDDYKISQRLTLNLGLRYDFQHNLNQPQLANNRFYQVLKTLGSPFGELPHASKLDFSPRVGLAWDARGNGKDVIRANFGMYYPVQVVTSFFTANYYEKPTLAFTQTITDSAVGCVPSPAPPAIPTTCQIGNYVLGGPLPVPFPPAGATNLVPGASSSSNANSSTGWYAPGLRDQYEMISHIGWAHQLQTNTSVSADYTHIQGVHEWRPIEINPLCTTSPLGVTAPGSPVFQGPCASPGSTGAAAAPVAVGQRILSNATLAAFGDKNLLGSLGVTSSIARSKYDELAVIFQRRSKRVTFQANYTLSWARGYGANVGGLFVSNAGGYEPEIPSAYGGCFFCAGEWGPGSADERHRLTLFGIIALPWGFQVSPTFTAASALPYQIYRANSPTGYGALRCLAGPTCGTAASTGTEVSVNAQRGSPLVNLNTRVSKMFKITESKAITGFVELYNLNNRPNFGANYGVNAFAPATFEKPLGYIGGLPGSSATVPASFQMQLGARFSF